MLIQVLGPGCTKCTEAEKLVREVLAESGIAATVEKVTDFKEMMALGVMSTPAIVIDRKVQCVGRVPAKKEILDWLTR